MQIEIDPQSAVPIYQQIRDRVVEAIACGELAEGDQLSSVRQLAVDFGINVATVAKAYDLLRSEGLIRTNHKSGSVIARGPGGGPADPTYVAEWTTRLTTLLAEAVTRGVADRDIVGIGSTVLERFASQRSRTERGTNA